jgi:DNA-binding FadR family transcriptional regulator
MVAAVAGKRAAAERDAATPMKPPHTSRQGQFLAYINHDITLHGRPPAEAEMMQFFQVTRPSFSECLSG